MIRAAWTEALAKAEGQWAFMTALTTGLAGRQYRAANLGGTPWTQFCFCERSRGGDALFYRVAWGKGGYYLAVRQYQKPPAPSPEEKRERLLALRKWWSAAAEKAGGRLKASRPEERGELESEVAKYLLVDNPPSVLRADLLRLHKAFLERLADEEWLTPGARCGANA